MGISADAWYSIGYQIFATFRIYTDLCVEYSVKLNTVHPRKGGGVDFKEQIHFGGRGRGRFRACVLYIKIIMIFNFGYRMTFELFCWV